jgi:hypothetical protein
MFCNFFHSYSGVWNETFLILGEDETRSCLEFGLEPWDEAVIFRGEAYRPI